MSGSSGHLTRRTAIKSLAALGALGFGGVASASRGADDPDDGDLFSFDEHVIGIDPDEDVARAIDELTSLLPTGGSVLRTNETIGFVTVAWPSLDVQTRESHIAQMESRSEVDYVEPNYRYETVQRGVAVDVSDPDFDEQYAPQQVRAPEAWERTYGSDDVVIAVADTGVEYDHPDLRDRFGDTAGRNFVYGIEHDDPSPLVGAEDHGTHVAGIASATTDNGTGIAGVSDSRLLAARVLNALGIGRSADIADAITWSADQGADLLNLSIGGVESETLQRACSYAFENGTLPIAAAGNDGSRGVSYPAAYDDVVAVSAVDENEEFAEFSQYGPEIDVTAPGVDVLSTVPGEFLTFSDGDYERKPGTSMACPAATGVAALGLAVDPSLSPAELRDLLKETAVDVGLDEERQGAGRVDAAALVDAV